MLSTVAFINSRRPIYGIPTSMEFLKDVFGFLATRKRYWLLPAIITIILLSTLVVLGSGSAISPFIYTIF